MDMKNLFRKVYSIAPGLLYYRLYLYQFYRRLLFPIGIKQIISKKFLRQCGYKPDFHNPKTFNEKLQWLKLYWRDPSATICADKYQVRRYVEQKGLKHLLNDLLGVWEKAEDIEFERLPDRFVLKANHGSGWNILCTDKGKLDISRAIRDLNCWLKMNYYYYGGEWPYKNIKPLIIAERYLVNADNSDLVDYKFMCFNGEPKCLFLCLDRFSALKVDFYDLNWNRMPFIRHYPNSNTPLPKPERFDEMIEYARVLAEGFPFVRVDFYLVEGKVYFGELTFFPGGGMEEFHPRSYDYLLGEWIKLPDRFNARGAK